MMDRGIRIDYEKICLNKYRDRLLWIIAGVGFAQEGVTQVATETDSPTSDPLLIFLRRRSRFIKTRAPILKCRI